MTAVFKLGVPDLAIVRMPPNEQLNITLYPGPRLAYAKPRTSGKRKLTQC